MASVTDNHRKVVIALSSQQGSEVDGEVEGCTLTLMIKQILHICLLNKRDGTELDVHLFGHFPTLRVPAFRQNDIAFPIICRVQLAGKRYFPIKGKKKKDKTRFSHFH